MYSTFNTDPARSAQALRNSKRVSWDINAKSISPDPELSPLYKDVFLHHWKEEAQHAILDELEWLQEDQRLSPAQRDAAVDDFIALVGAVDGLLQVQARAVTG